MVRRPILYDCFSPKSKEPHEWRKSRSPKFSKEMNNSLRTTHFTKGRKTAQGGPPLVFATSSSQAYLKRQMSHWSYIFRRFTVRIKFGIVLSFGINGTNLQMGNSEPLSDNKVTGLTTMEVTASHLHGQRFLIATSDGARLSNRTFGLFWDNKKLRQEDAAFPWSQAAKPAAIVAQSICSQSQ